MDNNELDYYRHETTCSNTCKSNKTISGIDSLGSSRDSSMSSLTAGSSFDDTHSRQNPVLGQTTSFERSSSEDSADVIDNVPRSEEIIDQGTGMSIQRFWKGVRQSELMEDVIKEILSQVTSLQQRTRAASAIAPEGYFFYYMGHIICHFFTIF